MTGTFETHHDSLQGRSQSHNAMPPSLYVCSREPVAMHPFLRLRYRPDRTDYQPTSLAIPGHHPLGRRPPIYSCIHIINYLPSTNFPILKTRKHIGKRSEEAPPPVQRKAKNIILRNQCPSPRHWATRLSSLSATVHTPKKTSSSAPGRGYRV